MKIDVITLFPEMITSVFEQGIISKSIRDNIIDLKTINPRIFTNDVHQSIDDRPYGGGPGMVMGCESLTKTFDYLKKNRGDGYKIYLSPQGKKLDHNLAKKLSTEKHLILLCGRYEGVDQRILDKEIDLECSIGDFVLSGGEIAACAIIDSVTRLIPGILGNDNSAEYDSFANGLLDHPHYTRPEVFDGVGVPEVLLSGNHKKINDYRLKQSLGATYLKRPDLISKRDLSEKELAFLEEFLIEYKDKV